MSEKKILVAYWSATGNTKKVADAITEELEKEGFAYEIKRVADLKVDEMYRYSAVFFGAPTYQFLPPRPVLNYLDDLMKYHRDQGDIIPCCPILENHKAIIFCTHSGPHTGIEEAMVAGKYMAQVFKHIRFEVLDEIYVVGECFNKADPRLFEVNTIGIYGDIRGRPNKEDLSEVKRRVSVFLALLR
jgi:hypothetical protein